MTEEIKEKALSGFDLGVKVDEHNRVHIIDGIDEFVFVLRNDKPFLVAGREVTGPKYEAIKRKAVSILRRLAAKAF